MSVPPYHTKTLADGKQKTLTSRIWTISEAKMVAEEQSSFLNAVIHVFDDKGVIVISVKPDGKIKNLY